MSDKRHDSGQSALDSEKLLKAFQAMSDELGRRGTMGELCLLGGTVMLFPMYYPADRIPVKAQYLVEGLFAEGKI